MSGNTLINIGILFLAIGFVGLVSVIAGLRMEIDKRLLVQEGHAVITAAIGDEVGLATIEGFKFEKEGTKILYVIPGGKK